MQKPKAVVLKGHGINCEEETAYACELAGAEAKICHLNHFRIEDADWILFPGGFSYGDELGAGRLLANKLYSFKEELEEFVASGGCILGICNGFQFLTKIGLLPGKLLPNKSGRFENRWCDLITSVSSPYTKKGQLLKLPVRHAEGRYQGDLPEEQVILRYAESRYPNNPNGSKFDAAGICDKTGRILGMMPHPEAYVRPEQGPSSVAEGALAGDGLFLFKSVVDFLAKQKDKSHA